MSMISFQRSINNSTALFIPGDSTRQSQDSCGQVSSQPKIVVVIAEKKSESLRVKLLTLDSLVIYN